MSLVTKASDKLRIEKSTLIVLLSLLAGAVYTYLQNSNPDLLQAGLKFGATALASSQVLYLLFMKDKDKWTSI